MGHLRVLREEYGAQSAAIDHDLSVRYSRDTEQQDFVASREFGTLCFHYAFIMPLHYTAKIALMVNKKVT